MDALKEVFDLLQRRVTAAFRATAYGQRRDKHTWINSQMVSGGLTADNCVFVDDSQENIDDVRRNCGINNCVLADGNFSDMNYK